MARMYKVTWENEDIQFTESYVDDSPTATIEQIPARFKSKTDRRNVRVVSVEDLGPVR